MNDAFGEELKKADRVAYVHSTPSGKVHKEMVHIRGFTKQCVIIVSHTDRHYRKLVQPYNLILLEHDSEIYWESECDDCKDDDCGGCAWEFLHRT